MKLDLTDHQQALLQAATSTGSAITKVSFTECDKPSRANPSTVTIHVWTPRVGKPWRQLSIYAIWHVLKKGQRFDEGCVHVCRSKSPVEFGPKRTDYALLMHDINKRLSNIEKEISLQTLDML